MIINNYMYVDLFCEEINIPQNMYPNTVNSVL